MVPTPNPASSEQFPAGGEFQGYGRPLSAMDRSLQANQWGLSAEADAAVVTQLRDELIFGELTPDRIHSLHETTRHIGDMELMTAETDGEIAGLLDASRWYARPKAFEEIEASQDDDVVGSHNEEAAVLSMDLKTLDSTAKELRRQMEAAGMSLRDPRDAYVAAFLHVGAHETAHAMMAGVSKLEQSLDTGRQVPRRTATRIYLANHPEQGFTGDWEEDVKIHEERLAEGYAQMVAGAALEKLGYSTAEVGVILNAIEPQPRQDEQKGSLGYGAPLSKEAIVAQLKETSQAIRSRNVELIHQADDNWQAKVAASQSPDTKERLARARSVKSNAETQSPTAEADQVTAQRRRLGSVMTRAFMRRSKQTKIAA